MLLQAIDNRLPVRASRTLSFLIGLALISSGACDQGNAHGDGSVDATSTGDAVGADGDYQCIGMGAGDSCSEPLIDRTWSLTLLDGTATIRFPGEVLPNLSPEFSCTGAWDGSLLSCGTLQWIRQGRTCMGNAYFRVESATSVAFWLGSLDESSVWVRATCSR